MQAEQTTDQTFRVTEGQEGEVGVAAFVAGAPRIVLWLGSENKEAARRLAYHLETQVDRVAWASEDMHDGSTHEAFPAPRTPQR